MEYIKKEDLIEGEIYRSTSYGDIFKYEDINGEFNPSILSTYHKKGATVGWGLNNIINATPEEKHWLESCITADKFITFEEAMKTFIPKPLPQFKIIETIETITKVENNEGNQFFIGDVVKCLNNNQQGKIISFKYSADKSNIIAITTFQQNIGIGIDKIEHYIEPKVEVKNETLLEKAKRLYPVGTKFNNYKLVKGGNWTVEVLTNNIIKESGTIKLINPEFPINKNRGSWTLYENNEWAEIIND